MIGSVRGRLTVATVLVVGAVAVLVALLAPRRVENALIADRLDAEVAVEAAVIRNPVIVTAENGAPLGSPELTALFGPDIAGLAGRLDDTGALDQLRSMRDDGLIVVRPITGVVAQIDTSDRVRVEAASSAAASGPVVTGARLERLAAELDPASVFDSPFDIFAGDGTLDDFLGQITSELEGGLDSLDLGELGELVDLDDLSEIGRQLFDDEFFDELPDDLFEALPENATALDAPSDIDQLVFGTRNVDDVVVIVTASTDGIDITTDRIRDALWITVPIAMLLTGLVTWLLAGRALRPVRAITDQTGKIRTGTLHERVPVPAAGDEVSRLATEMNEMLDRLESEDRRRRQFVADASHELRSPIASIHTQAEVALAHDDDTVNELADGVLAEAERLGTIVDDLLALARHDETLLPPGSAVDLDDIVLVDAARPRRVEVDATQVSAGRVRGRPDELARVVTHLLDNAARHADEKVRLRLRTVDNRVLLDVDDDGPGVPDADRNRIFERFVRLDEARVRDAGGAGLGLSVVETVVQAAGGSVTVGESDLGGAHFRVDLPAAD